MRGFEGGTEGVFLGAGAVVLIGLAFVAGGGGCRGEDDPMDDADRKCEEAWVVEFDGDDETVNETAILEQPWCQAHLAAEQQQEETAP